MKSIYVVNEMTDSYRWIGLPDSEEQIGIDIAKSKFTPLAEKFKAITIQWLPETYNREVCDFPNFNSQFTCFSKNSLLSLREVIDDAGEFIKLCGIDFEYTAFHCLTVYDALDLEKFIEIQKKDKFFSLASPNTTPPLLGNKIGNMNIFHIPQVNNKFFVTQLFKDVYENNSLTGLSFHEVPVS